MPAKKDKVTGPLHFALTPIEDLIDDGLTFNGENGKDQLINQFDFMCLREIIQRNGQAPLTIDQQSTLLRYLRKCVKESA